MEFIFVMFIVICGLSFALAYLTEMYSEKGKEKASAKVKAEASVNHCTACRACRTSDYSELCHKLKKAG